MQALGNDNVIALCIKTQKEMNILLTSVPRHGYMKTQGSAELTPKIHLLLLENCQVQESKQSAFHV